MRRAFRPLTAHSRLCSINPGDGGYITAEPIPSAGRVPLDKVSRSGARSLVELVFLLRLCQFGRLFLFPLVQQGHDLLLHFGRSDLLAEILVEFVGTDDHVVNLPFFFAQNTVNDIAVAQRLGITATTLDGILTVKGQRRR